MTTNTNIDKVTGALADFNRVEAGLAALTKQYAGVVYDVTTTEGIEAARVARRAIREPRYEVEKVRKDAKAPLLALGRQIDDEAKRITSALLKIETPIDQQIAAEEARREAERQAKIRAEQERVEIIRKRIEHIRGMATTSASASVDTISRRISELAQISIDSSFAEFADEANRTLTETVTALQDLHAAAQEREAEQARIAAERAELEQLRAARAKREAAEREQLEAEQRRIATERVELERLRAEAARRDADDRARIAEEEKRSRAAIEAEQAELQRQRAALIAEQKAAADARADEELRAARAAAPAQEVRSARPTDDEIVAALMGHFQADRNEVMEWLVAFAGRRATA